MSNTLIHCPWHFERTGKEDKHPSLNADLEKNVFFCHGCGAKGVLSQHPELAIEARRMGEQGFHPLIVPRVLEAIPPLGGFVLEYLLGRGFTIEILRRFEVGGNTDRVWIPVKLKSGQVVGTIFRFLPGVEGGRYVYSSGFQKRNCVFGSYQFEPDRDTVCLVEGAFDCIRMYQLGITNTVALLGDQPAAGQFELVKQLGHTVILALDNDEPGQEATVKVGQLLQHRGHEVLLLKYEGKDPGELKNTKSFELQPFLSFLLEKEVLKASSVPY